MQYIRRTYKNSFKGITLILLVLFGLHFLSIHSFAENLVYCFEEDGQVRIETEEGSLFSIPSGELVHAEGTPEHQKTTFSVSSKNHTDVPLSLFFSNEDEITRTDQERILEYFDNFQNAPPIESQFPSASQLSTYIPPFIENVLITNLQTVVLLN